MPEETSKASKPLIIIGALVLLLMASAFIPARWLGVQPQKSGYTPIDFNKLSQINSYANDTDGNGKISWKELIGSTEGGAELLTETANILPDPEAIARLNDPDNLTSSLTKNIYIASTYMEKSGITDAESQQKVLDQLVSEEAAKIASKQYLYADINVATSEDKQSIRTYGNKVATILEGMITEDSINKDSTGLFTFMSTEDTTAITPLIEDYQKMDERVKRMLSLSVPPSASLYHLIAINQMVVYRDTLYNLSKAPTDLMRTNLVFKKYPDTIIATLLVYDKLAAYFNVKNVVFSSQEPGYVFTVGYTIK